MGSCQQAFPNPKGLSSLSHGEHLTGSTSRGASLLKEHKMKMKDVDTNRTEKVSVYKK
jgi:hypothetical protein